MSKIDFIVVSNDDIHNTLSKKTIGRTYPNAKIQSFADPVESLDFISKKPVTEGQITILYVSIFMNPISGFTFADEVEKMEDKIKQSIRLMLVTSGINKNDMKKAQVHNQVEYYLVAPLTKETIQLTVDEMKKKKVTQNR